jgi:methionyl-tRNA formyltransferase
LPRAVFFGTPAFAVPCLEALFDVAEVVLVVSQPDRRAGRGMKLVAPPVKELARARGVEVIQPLRVRSGVLAERVRAAEADVALVVAYGRILPAAVLDAPRVGCLNIHASLLPRWRGAAPVQWAIVEGDSETGVSLMQMDEGMDTGPVLASASISIGPDETAEELSPRLSTLGADLVRRDLPRALDGALVPQPQDHSRATMAPLLGKEDGRLDWSEAARRVHDRVRGLTPWPGAFTTLREARVKVLSTRCLGGAKVDVSPGTILGVDADGVDVACGEGAVHVLELQAEGKRRLPARDFAAGHRLRAGMRFGASNDEDERDEDLHQDG